MNWGEGYKAEKEVVDLKKIMRDDVLEQSSSAGRFTKSYTTQTEIADRDMSQITREEIDAKLGRTDARIEASEARIESALEKIHGDIGKINTRLDHMPSTRSMIWTMAGFTGALFASLLTIVAIVGDRSDTALSVGASLGGSIALNQSLIDDVRREGREARSEIDEKTQQILEAIQSLETRTNRDAATK